MTFCARLSLSRDGDVDNRRACHLMCACACCLAAVHVVQDVVRNRGGVHDSRQRKRACRVEGHSGVPFFIA